MRYLGNKDTITEDIKSFLNKKGLLKSKYTFFDAFAGTGAVADSLKSDCNLVINDLLEWSVVYTRGRIVGSKTQFKKLGFNPFEFINKNDEILHGFFYKNYSPAETARMYFSEFNAGRIDYIRNQIQEWYDNDFLSRDEYDYLLASLIESMSKVANTAGVYGAFLKHWDSRALKKMVFFPVPHDEKPVCDVTTINGKIEDVVSQVDADILYLDPPYTQNQYGTQYHIFETLIKNDNPDISKVTGSRPTGPMRSDWSKKNKAEILFDQVLATTKAKYVLLSYNNDGLMSKDFIEASMKRYGKTGTFDFKKIPYKKYRNFKTKKNNEHFEYLFYIELKDKCDVVYESPLNYIGSKARIISKIAPYFSKQSKNIYDVFGGGFNVGINFRGEELIYNDINFKVKEIIQMFSEMDTYKLIQSIQRYIKKFDLKAADSDAYKAARDFYNSLPDEKQKPEMLYTIILYGFQQQIRFNTKLGFNNPVGMRWFNERIYEKLISFSRKIKESNVSFYSESFDEMVIPSGPETLIYLDPPYRLTTGSYNDGKRGFKGWNGELEQNLFRFIEERHQSGNKILFSYVLKHRDEFNDELQNWIDENPDFHVVDIEGNSGWRGSKREEILVMNYEN
ncbi:DNA adenine methylase [Fructobacillus fructosus]|uniref:DNA adenine methylase n=1 Tax=Fructobacillus fructosus TaxID=1631 RepID=UPI00200B435E|nr:DNA adenine methylase [Fructobacillus fructosus]